MQHIAEEHEQAYGPVTRAPLCENLRLEVGENLLQHEERTFERLIAEEYPGEGCEVEGDEYAPPRHT